MIQICLHLVPYIILAFSDRIKSDYILPVQTKRAMQPYSGVDAAYRNLRAKHINLAYPVRYTDCIYMHFETLRNEREVINVLDDYQRIALQQGSRRTVFIVDCTNFQIHIDLPVQRLIALERILKPHFQIIIGANHLVRVYADLVKKFVPYEIEFVSTYAEAIALAQTYAASELN